MPNIRSAKKRVKVIRKKTLRNRMVKSQLRTAIKRFDSALNDKESAKEVYAFAVKKLDQAVLKGVLHKNTAARKKSKIALRYNALV